MTQIKNSDVGWLINIKKCPFCGSKHTQFVDDKKNYILLCLSCFGFKMKGGIFIGKTNKKKLKK